MRRFVVLALGLTLGIAACADESQTPVQFEEAPPATLVMDENAIPDDYVPIEIDVEAFLRDFPKGDQGDLLTSTRDLFPTTFSATLAPGESATESKEALLAGAPPRGDVVFSFDLTGSMGGELNNVKSNAVDIMTAVAGVIDDVSFGVVSYMDYPQYYSTFTPCTYSATYGSAAGGDYPYRMDQAVTGTPGDVAAAINGLVLGSGWDFPESYSRAFFESYSDATIGWRGGAKKIFVNFADAVPHDLVQRNNGTFACYGIDPGRDAAIGGGDDLLIDDVIDGMADANITLINLFSGFASPTSGWSNSWDGWAAATGGVNFQINPDGTFPGGVDPGTAIADLIAAEVATIDEFTLQVCDDFAEFDGWLSGVEPAAYFDTTVDEPIVLDFDLTFTVPDDAEDGVYTFDVCGIGDGAEYGRQLVEITVESVVDAVIDIKPGSWPNSINLGNGKSNGKSNDAGANIAVALFSTPDFDATAADPTTVTLGDESDPDTGVATKKNGSYFMATEDVDGDGLLDVVFHFNRDQLIANGDLDLSSTYLVMWGETLDGTLFTGSDAVRPVGK
jgi:hypothetical protein